MYCWGKAQEGALGVGGIEDLHVTTPKWNNYIGHQNVKSVGKYMCIVLFKSHFVAVVQPHTPPKPKM